MVSSLDRIAYSDRGSAALLASGASLADCRDLQCAVGVHWRDEIATVPVGKGPHGVAATEKAAMSTAMRLLESYESLVRRELALYHRAWMVKSE